MSTIKGPTYFSWVAMKQRCTNPNHDAFCHYGGRGIKVCERWINSYVNFLNDLGPKPKGFTLGRIDNNGDYDPSNCRWESKEQQFSNTRNNRWIEHDGVKMTSAQWARKIGISPSALCARLRHGWTIAQALSIPKSTSYTIQRLNQKTPSKEKTK